MSSPPSTSGSLPLPPAMTTSVDELVAEKTAKIKQWVKNRLHDLEVQNERLREQNLRCSTQLALLKSFSEKKQQWQSQGQHRLPHDMAAMSRSVTGALPVLRDMENRTSDDSGLTSDDPGGDRRAAEAAMCRSSIETRTSSNTPGTSTTPRQQRKPVRLRATSKTQQRSSGDGEDKESTSSTSDSSPWDERARPLIPPARMPRILTNPARDSLNSFADDYEFDCEEETFDEIAHDSPEPRLRRKQQAEYVNLADFCAIRDDANIYSDIVRSPVEATPPPRPPHQRARLFERTLEEVAARCLSMTEAEAGEGGSSPSPFGYSEMTPPSSNTPAGHRVMSGDSVCGGGGVAFRGAEYASPLLSHPAQAASSSHSSHLDRHLVDMRTSIIPTTDQVEKSGYWSQASDSRLKSLKRRYVILRNGQLLFFRTHKKSRDEEPLQRLPVSDIRSVNLVPSAGGAFSFQLTTESGGNSVYMTESEKSTTEWVQAISAAVKGATLREMAARAAPVDASMAGFVTRVRCGHSRRVYAALLQHKLMFFKGSDDTIPSAYICVSGARVSEAAAGSSDEYSGSSDEQLEEKPPPGKGRGHDGHSYSLCIQLPNEDPLYMVISSLEEKEKWLYFLRAAAGDATLKGTPFEVLMQRMLADGLPPGSALWKDLLLTSGNEPPAETLMTCDSTHRKKALEIAKAAHLFVSVLLRPIAVAYHIDLAQNILSTAVQNEHIRNELYAQLIRLTAGSMPFAVQGWKLLALALPLFTPRHYALFWLLRRHLARWAVASASEESAKAGYCEAALERALRMGGRHEGPSRLETNSILTRDPTTTKFPHSISVRLPNDEYQVVELDGSTEVGQCLSSLCLKLGMRPALLSGYALYIDEPATQQLQLLKGKQKVCDCLSIWERRQKDSQKGRVASEAVAHLVLRQRHYWRHLAASEPPIERTLLAWRMAEQIRLGRLPLSPQLADHLLALYAQMTIGDAPCELKEEQFEFLTTRFYPLKMLQIACIRTLKSSLLSSWAELSGMAEEECVRIILHVLRKWPLFGADLHDAALRTSNERKVFLALLDSSIHVIDQRHMDVIRSFPYHRLVSFGELHGNFMLTAERVLTADAHPEENSKERLTFTMAQPDILQVSLHLAEYIRCQKLVWKMSK